MSSFMDKQILDLSSSASFSLPQHNKDKDLIDLMNRTEDDTTQRRSVMGGDGGGDKGFEHKEEIFPSYDFQPIRTATSLSGSTSNSRVWNSVDLKPSSPSPIKEKDHKCSDANLLMEIDTTVKKHTDNLMHVLEGVSARLSQLETRARNVENLVDDLKVYVGNNHGSIEGKMRQLENVLGEVQTGVQILKDKQEVMESQLQLSKLQVSKSDHQPEPQNSTNASLALPTASAAPQAHLHFPASVSMPQSLPSMPPPAPNPPQALPQHGQFPPPGQAHQSPSQFPPPEPYFPPAGQSQMQLPSQLPYQAPPPTLTQPPPPPPAQPQPPPQPPHQQPYQSPMYSQPSPPVPQPPLGLHHEEMPYPQQSYPPSLRPASSQPPSGSGPSQQYYPPPPMYEQPHVRPSSGFPSGYGPPPSGPSDPYPYGGPPKLPHSGGPAYPSRAIPHALPTASSISGGSGSPRSGDRVPIDDVVDKVTSMGFTREHVRTIVRRLTENGQAVDLNIVLDKLMNDRDLQGPQRGGWYGR